MTKQDFYELLNRTISLGPIACSDMPNFEKEPVEYQQWERKRFHWIMKENEDEALPFFIQALYPQTHKEDEGSYAFLFDDVAFFYGGTKHAQMLLKNLLPIWEIQHSDWTENDIMEFARDIYLHLIEGNIEQNINTLIGLPFPVAYWKSLLTQLRMGLQSKWVPEAPAYLQIVAKICRHKSEIMQGDSELEALFIAINEEWATYT